MLAAGMHSAAYKFQRDPYQKPNVEYLLRWGDADGMSWQQN